MIGRRDRVSPGLWYREHLSNREGDRMAIDTRCSSGNKNTGRCRPESLVGLWLSRQWWTCHCVLRPFWWRWVVVIMMEEGKLANPRLASKQGFYFPLKSLYQSDHCDDLLLQARLVVCAKLWCKHWSHDALKTQASHGKAWRHALKSLTQSPVSDSVPLIDWAITYRSFRLKSYTWRTMRTTHTAIVA